jgi:hypothetical protein
MKCCARSLRDSLSISRIVEDVVRWDVQMRDYRSSGRSADGDYLTTRCVPSPTLIVCVQTIAADPDALASVRAGLEITDLPNSP